MRFESAELAKISINMCLVSSVSTANTLAELCEKIGADWSEIVPALKLDKRIGHYSYLAPGLGIAGGNLERDLATVCNFADEYGTDAGVVRSWIANSRHRRDWALRTLQAELLSKAKDPVIAVLGLAYKQDTHSIKNSPSLALLEHLKDCQVRVYDPVVPATVVSNPRCHRREIRTRGLRRRRRRGDHDAVGAVRETRPGRHREETARQAAARPVCRARWRGLRSGRARVRDAGQEGGARRAGTVMEGQGLKRRVVRLVRHLVLVLLDLKDRVTGRSDKLVPPRSLHFVGGGDFREVGRTYLGHFRGIAGLGKGESVLDIGCGTGRMAVPLIDYLDAGGRYTGFDISAPAIAWCGGNITAVNPRFRFVHADVYNLEYNPKGGTGADAYRFPCEDASVDFAFATSVFTHMHADEIRNYLAELGRVLRPGRPGVADFLHLRGHDRPARSGDGLPPRAGRGADDRPADARARDGLFGRLGEAGLRRRRVWRSASPSCTATGPEGPAGRTSRTWSWRTAPPEPRADAPESRAAGTRARRDPRCERVHLPAPAGLVRFGRHRVPGGRQRGRRPRHRGERAAARGTAAPRRRSRHDFHTHARQGPGPRDADAQPAHGRDRLPRAGERALRALRIPELRRRLRRAPDPAGRGFHAGAHRPVRAVPYRAGDDARVRARRQRHPALRGCA